MASANEKRLAVRDKYKGILGRNLYSQPRRLYCFKRYSDGKYYSDCSSSIMESYKAAGYPISSSCLNTVGMYQSKALVEVPVKIKNGVIQNPEVLRIGDIALFAGTDSSRAYADYVGHVEMIGEISGGKVYLYGHGSGTPRRTEMNAYCRSRYASKTGTKIGNKGLLKVVRFIQDDGTDTPNNSGSPNSSAVSRVLKKGMRGADVKALQAKLIGLGYSCGKSGADGDFGADTEAAVKKFQREHGCQVDGQAGEKTLKAIEKAMDKGHGEVSGNEKNVVKIVDGQCYVREAPNTSGNVLGVVKEGTTLPYQGQQSANGWLLVIYKNQNAWISGKYGKLVK